MQIYLLRHGQSIGNTTREIVSGRSDTRGLTQNGKNQVLRSAWELCDTKVAKIYTSPVFRAVESATIVSEVLQKPLCEASFLNEWDHGVIEGERWDQVDHLLPEVFRNRRKEDFYTSYIGGESLEMVARRVWDGFLGFVKEHYTNESYVLVSHMAIICTILYGIQNENPVQAGDRYTRYIHSNGVPNASITHIDIQEERVSVLNISRSFPPFKHTEDRVTQYARAHLKKDYLKASYISTSSVTNEVYMLKSTDTYICKLMYDQEPVRAERLIKLYSYLQSNTNIPSPRLIHADTSYIFFSNPVLIQDYVEGQEQLRCFEQMGDRTDLFTEVMNVLDCIHSIPPSEVSEFWMPDDWDAGGITRWEQYMKIEIQKTQSAITQIKEVEQYSQFVNNKLSNLSSYIQTHNHTFVPIHGDMAPTNIIVSSGSHSCCLLRVLDFERAQIADPLWEYAYYYGWLMRDSASAAQVWKNIVSKKVSSEEMKIFHLYTILFHAWTIRDTITYKGHTSREKVGVQSVRILEQLCS